MTSLVSPVLKTTITKSDVSTSSKLRFYVKRDLNVKSKGDLTRTSLHLKFQSLCDQELEYQSLTSDISISCFCRTGVIGTSVILEADCDSDTVRQHLQNLTLTPLAAESVANYLITLHRKSCVCNNPSTRVSSKFRCENNRDIIIKSVFEDSMRKFHKNSPVAKIFGDEDMLQKINALTEKLTEVEACVIHANFTGDNVVIKNSPTSCFKVVVFGGELSHIGNPAYDVGSFLADLFIWYHIHDANSEKCEQSAEFCLTIQHCISEFLTIYFDDFDLSIRDDKIVGDMYNKCGGYAGISMIFRTIGNDWNEKLTFESSSVRSKILSCATQLIKGYGIIDSLNELSARGLGLN